MQAETAQLQPRRPRLDDQFDDAHILLDQLARGRCDAHSRLGRAQVHQLLDQRCEQLIALQLGAALRAQHVGPAFGKRRPLPARHEADQVTREVVEAGLVDQRVKHQLQQRLRPQPRVPLEGGLCGRRVGRRRPRGLRGGRGRGGGPCGIRSGRLHARRARGGEGGGGSAGGGGAQLLHRQVEGEARDDEPPIERGARLAPLLLPSPHLQQQRVHPVGNTQATARARAASPAAPSALGGVVEALEAAPPQLSDGAQHRAHQRVHRELVQLVPIHQHHAPLLGLVRLASAMTSSVAATAAAAVAVLGLDSHLACPLALLRPTTAAATTRHLRRPRAAEVAGAAEEALATKGAAGRSECATSSRRAGTSGRTPHGAVRPHAAGRIVRADDLDGAVTAHAAVRGEAHILRERRG